MFSRTLEAIDRLATNDKIEYFAKLLGKGYFLGDKINNNDFQEHYNSLNLLSYKQIKLLLLLREYEQLHPDDSFKNKLQKANVFWNEFLTRASEMFELESDEIKDMLAMASLSGFCREITGAYFDYSGGVFYTTKTFDKLARKISDEVV